MVSQERERTAVETADEMNEAVQEEQVSLTDESSEIPEEEMDMDSLMEESMSSSVESGQISIGHVVKVSESDVTVDVGLKSEGIIPLDEFRDENGEPDVKVGQDIEVLVIRSEGRDGLPVLSRRRAKERQARKHIRKAFDQDQIIRCYVKTILKGGFEVDVNGLRGFIPFSQMGPGARTPEDQKSLVGQTIEAKILEMRNKRDLILSQRKAIDEKRENLRQETLSNLQEGLWVKGVVKNLTDFGAFIDLGGIDGLLHVKDMSWDHVAHPRDMVKVGDEIDVMVLSIEGERISLGLKQKSPDPWLTVQEKYAPGTTVPGKVTSLTKYGAFVCLEEGVEGLIHVSEMSWIKRVRHPNEMLKEGDEVHVKVLSIDENKKRISLSLRQTAVDPWTLAKANYPTGTIIEGEVTGMTDFGAFVRLPEGVDGMIHISDLSWMDKAMHPKKILKKGEKIRCKVLEIDPDNQRISLGLKQMESNPWDEAAAKYKVNSVHTVEVKRVTEFGAFVELEEGIEGLAHYSALVPKGQRHEDVIKVGDKLMMKVTKFDKENQKISLSLREFQKDQEKQEVEQFMKAESGGNATLGEMLGAQLQRFANTAEEEEEEISLTSDEPEEIETEQTPEEQTSVNLEAETPVVEQQVEEAPAVETPEEDVVVQDHTAETPPQDSIETSTESEVHEVTTSSEGIVESPVEQEVIAEESKPEPEQPAQAEEQPSEEEQTEPSQETESEEVVQRTIEAEEQDRTPEVVQEEVQQEVTHEQPGAGEEEVAVEDSEQPEVSKTTESGEEVPKTPEELSEEQLPERGESTMGQQETAPEEKSVEQIYKEDAQSDEQASNPDDSQPATPDNTAEGSASEPSDQAKPE